MDAQEFRKDFLENVKAEAAATGEGSCAAFVDSMAQYLVEAEVLPDFTPAFYTSTTSKRKIYRVDGYVFDEFDYTMNLIIADYDGVEERTMGKVASSTNFQRLAVFVDQALNTNLYREIEMSTPCADLVDLLRLEKERIRKYRLLIFTDADVSDTLKNLDNLDIGGIPAECQIWDIDRVFRVCCSDLGRQNIEIDFREYIPAGIPCLEASSAATAEYNSYLCIIPGKVLADIYDKYGSQLLEGNVRSFLSTKVAVNKKIRETYLGKLILDGNFSVMIPDMYAFMQHAFGHTVTGALKEFEHYSYFWNKRGKTDVVAMRSPLTWRSEVNKLNLKNNELTEKWFKYLTSGIVYNVWGCDCIIHADSDFDGDIVATTDNPVFLRCRYDNLPITYSKSTVDKEYISEDELYKADIQSFDSTIGRITNISTAFYEILARYEGDITFKREQDEILERLKLIRKSQGDSIDKAKGIKIEPMPKHWTRKISKKPDNVEDIDFEFYNSIVADKKPYFFRYLYSSENSKYLKYLDKENDVCMMLFQKSIYDILDSAPEDLTEAERDYLIDKFYPYSPLIDYNGRMNKICHYMEKHLSEIKRKRHMKTPEHLVKSMYSGTNLNFAEEDIEYMNAQYLDYKAQKDSLRVKRKSDYTHSVSQTSEFIKYPLAIRDRISDKFIGDVQYAYRQRSFDHDQYLHIYYSCDSYTLSPHAGNKDKPHEPAWHTT